MPISARWSAGCWPARLRSDAGRVGKTRNRCARIAGPWGGSSAGRASRSQCEGREFDPHPLHQRIPAVPQQCFHHQAGRVPALLFLGRLCCFQRSGLGKASRGKSGQGERRASRMAGSCATECRATRSRATYAHGPDGVTSHGAAERRYRTDHRGTRRDTIAHASDTCWRASRPASSIVTNNV
jgi:hypothetical protein